MFTAGVGSLSLLFLWGKYSNLTYVRHNLKSPTCWRAWRRFWTTPTRLLGPTCTATSLSTRAAKRANAFVGRGRTGG